MTIDPRGMTVFQWTDAMALLLNGTPPAEKLLREEDWQSWAENVVNGVEGATLPDPYQFNDWREWAQRLNATVDFEG